MNTTTPCIAPLSVAIHIVDDDRDIRDGLAWLFDSRQHSVVTWSRGDDFVRHAQAQAPQWDAAVVVLDVRMEPLSGLATFEQLQQLACPWPVIFLTGHGDLPMAVDALRQGAWHFLEKPFQNNQLVDHVERAIAHVQAQWQSQQEMQTFQTRLNSLSDKEKAVLHELLQGHYNKNIADHLGMPQRTVEFHRANILSKLGLDSAVELAHQMGRLQTHQAAHSAHLTGKVTSKSLGQPT